MVRTVAPTDAAVNIRPNLLTSSHCWLLVATAGSKKSVFSNTVIVTRERIDNTLKGRADVIHSPSSTTNITVDGATISLKWS